MSNEKKHIASLQTREFHVEAWQKSNLSKHAYAARNLIKILYWEIND